MGHSGVTTRLPPRGPRTPISDPTLLLVTQDHRVNVCYFRKHGTIFKIITSLLSQPGTTSEHQSQLGEDNDLNNKRCFRAAIGLHYNGNLSSILAYEPILLLSLAESSILIATRSSFLPPPLADVEPQFNSTDITFSMDIPQEPSLEIRSMEWETWCEETTINICEVKFNFDGMQMSESIP